MNRVKMLLRLANAFRRAYVADEWNEDEHNREKNGQFAEKENSGESTASESGVYAETPSSEENFTPLDISEILGEEFIGYKGTAAVNKLLKEKKGHIKGAFKNKTFGDIALLYGDETLGLCHIIAHRKKQGFTDEKIKALLDSLDDVITNGKVEPSKTGNETFEVYKEGKVAIISPKLSGNRFTFVLTAYKSRNKK